MAWKIFLLELLRSSDGKFSEFSVHFLLKNFEKKVENVNYESHFMSLYAFGFCASTWKMNASFLFFISRKISFLSRSNQITPQCERWKVLIFNLRNNAKRFVFFFSKKAFSGPYDFNKKNSLPHSRFFLFSFEAILRRVVR